MCIADRRAERGRAFRTYHADDPPPVGRPQDHKAVLVYLLFYRGNGVPVARVQKTTIRTFTVEGEEKNEGLRARV